MLGHFGRCGLTKKSRIESGSAELQYAVQNWVGAVSIEESSLESIPSADTNTDSDSVRNC